MRSSKAVKRMLCLALIAATLILTAAPALASSRPNGAYVVNTFDGDRLIVHPNPSIAGEVTRLKPGTVVVYKSQKSGWWRIAFYNGYGYVDPKYLVSATSLPGAKFKAMKALPVYAKSKSSSKCIGTMSKSMKVSIIDKKDSWVRVRRSNGYTGWVSAKYLYRVS